MKAKKTVSLAEYEKLKKWYATELKRRDKQLEKLKKENVALLKAALKQGLATREIEERVKTALKK